MHNPEYIWQNETYKLLWDFETQKDYQISARLLDLIIINKAQGTCRIVNFAVPADHRVELKVCERGISTSKVLGK